MTQLTIQQKIKARENMGAHLQERINRLADNEAFGEFERYQVAGIVARTAAEANKAELPQYSGHFAHYDTLVCICVPVEIKAGVAFKPGDMAIASKQGRSESWTLFSVRMMCDVSVPNYMAERLVTFGERGVAWQKTSNFDDVEG